MKSPIWIAVLAWAVSPPAFARAGSDDARPVPPPADPASLLPPEYRPAVLARLARAGDNAGSLAAAIGEAPPAQRAAVGFLVANMPDRDLKGLGKDYLLANVRLAYLAREATPWAAKVPEELFFEAVLPYASVNERRDDWRRDFFDRFLALAKDSATPGEAARKLNVEVFRAFKVAYHATRRPKPDQSPYESIDAGYASCTGLSILLIDACRAVGIPARLVGTPRWADNSGNHTWVEVWDREWSFVGACEPGPLNQGWFVGQAAKADESRPLHRIYATSFREAEDYFPMVWRPDLRDVPAEDVTRRYTLRRKVTFRFAGPAEVTVRRLGRIVAHDHAATDSATFELAGNLPYEVTLGKATPKTIKVTADPDQVIDLR